MYKAQQLDKAYYQGLEIENEDLRKLKHDYKNHLLNLKQLIAYQNTEASLQYINKYKRYIKNESLLQYFLY